MAAPVRKLLGSKSKARVIALSNNAAAENEMTKPSAIIAGRALPVCPTDAPSRIGNIGSVQGAAIGDDAGEQGKNEIEHRKSTERRAHLGPCGRDAQQSFGMSGWRVTSGLIRGRHVFVRRFNTPKRKATREGGIPSGSLEVTWEVGRSGRLETLEDQHNLPIFPPDVVDCFICFVAPGLRPPGCRRRRP